MLRVVRSTLWSPVPFISLAMLFIVLTCSLAQIQLWVTTVSMKLDNKKPLAPKRKMFFSLPLLGSFFQFLHTLLLFLWIRFGSTLVSVMFIVQTSCSFVDDFWLIKAEIFTYFRHVHFITVNLWCLLITCAHLFWINMI